MDSMNDLDRELTAALGVEPPPDFAARVRARIASEPAADRWRVPGFALVTGGLALGALVVNMMLAPARSNTSAVAPVLPHQSFAWVVPLRAAPPSITPRIEPARGAHATPSGVLVSHSEMLALQRLFAGAIVAPPAAPVPDELSIQELAIDVILLPTILEGEQQ
jgi:hypothetical protein